MTSEKSRLQEEVISELKDILADEFPVLISTFLEDAVQRITRLEAAIADSDAGNIRIEAHSLKGSSINLGVANLADLCSQMESCGVKGELESVSSLMEDIQSEFVEVEGCLKQHIN